VAKEETIHMEDALDATAKVLAKHGVVVTSKPGREGRDWKRKQLAQIHEHPLRHLKDLVPTIDKREKIARALGKDETYITGHRILHVLDCHEREGNTCMPLSVLKESVTTHAGMGRHFEAGLRLMQDWREIHLHEHKGRSYAYRAYTWRQEETVIREISRLMSSPPAKPLPFLYEDIIVDVMEELGLELNEHQRCAIEMVFGNQVSILSGYAGTGKTTVLRVIGRVAEALGLETRMAAPTGAAAKRIRDSQAALARAERDQFSQSGRWPLCSSTLGVRDSQATLARASRDSQQQQHSACTIHRLLEATWVSDRFIFRRNAANPIQAQFVIVDEASMLDLNITSKLLSAIRSGCMVLFIGDPAQLPSVMPGRVLQDLIASDMPHMGLTKVLRQAACSSIIRFAHQVRNDQLAMGPGEHDDFVWEDLEDVGDMMQRAHDVVSGWRDEDGTRSFQVICPMRKPTLGGVSAHNMNVMIQKTINREEFQRHVAECQADGGGRREPSRFVRGDRVMFTRNDPDLGLLNGDKGTVIDVLWRTMKKKHQQEPQQQWEVLVQYDGYETVHSHASSDASLELAWVVTVHKSQGDQYDHVLVLLHRSHGRLLNRELLYTGATRAKSRLVLLSDVRSVRSAIGSVGGSERVTLLGERLAEVLRRRM
jgi:exodeoxyribonuclease V alpha subunit